ncbi:serine/threonine-protein kinase [Cryptosporangium phraense]|uniref:non-specific serine/threonine protein kinase n=1 Tax=Cryptosporangium phraense TaxID=2593070 RepID=A0A545AKP3_9ACTN|nr:serine/threonine-protein kinase [Cryptosporangium phraense]TQS41315.1 serine/threonine protein kinase [Cryptosporangium phraense]
MRLIAGRYELQRELGAGGMGAVWLGRDQLLRRSVAIKEVRLAPMDASGATRLTAAGFAEARTVAALSHTHIIPVYDVVEHRSRPWIVMPAVEGPTLQQRVAADGPLPVELVARIGDGLAQALDTAHGQGIIHRDVKPANVLLSDEDHPWLADFGIAQWDEEKTPAAKGSAGYAAPEQVRGDPPTRAVDVFGLGATLYYAVEGEHAFTGEDPWATLMAPSCGAPRKPERAGWLGPVLVRMMARNPEDRLTLAQVRQALADRRIPTRSRLDRLRRR